MIHDIPKLNARRQAFTLIEILVVIAIIAVLAGLGAWGTIAMIGTQQRRNTESLVRVLDKLLHDRWKEVIDKAREESPSPQVVTLAGGDPERARVIWAKVRLVEAFPMSYNEVNAPATIVSTYIPSNRRKSYFATYKTALASNPGPAPGESSACLLMALRTLKGDGVRVDDQLKHAITSSDGVNQIDILNDGFNRPLAFFRFAPGGPMPAWVAAQAYLVGNGVTFKNVHYICIQAHTNQQPPNGTYWMPSVEAMNPAAAGSAAFKHADSVDNGGKLLTNSWYFTSPPPNSPNPLRVTFESQFHLVSPDNTAHAYYVIPVIASAGKDGNMALTNFAGPVNAGANDNIYSFNLRGN